MLAQFGRNDEGSTNQEPYIVLVPLGKSSGDHAKARQSRVENHFAMRVRSAPGWLARRQFSSRHIFAIPRPIKYNCNVANWTPRGPRSSSIDKSPASTPIASPQHFRFISTAPANPTPAIMDADEFRKAAHAAIEDSIPSLPLHMI
jgi:hypothetical protein